MKKYIKPSIKVTEIELESNLCDTSLGISNDVYEGDAYSAPTPEYGRYSVWGNDEEEK